MKSFKYIELIVLTIVTLFIYSYFYFFNKEYLIIINSGINTIVLSLIIVIFSTLIGGFLSYVLYFYKINSKKIIFLLLIFPFIIPSYIMSMLYLEYSDILISDFGYVFIMTLVSIPYSLIFIYLGLTNLKHKDILVLDSYNINKKDIFIKIIFNYIKIPIIISSFLIFAISFTEFGTAIFTGANVLIIKVYELWFTSYEIEKALNVIFFSYGMFLFIIAYLIYRKRNNISISYIKDTKQFFIYKGIYNDKIILSIFWLILITIVSLQTIIPLFILGKWTILSYDFFKLENIYTVIYNSLYIVFFSVIVTLSVTILLFKFYSEKNIVFYSILQTNYFIPSLFLGILGLYVIEKLELGMSMTFIILLLALTIKYIPISISLFNEKFNSLNKKTILIANMFDKSKIWILKKIILPHLYLSIVLSFLVLTLKVIKELPITLLLRPLEMDTLAVKAYYYSSAEMLYVSGIWIMILISIIVLLSILIYYIKKKI